eukprot:TRINITY_DN2236_c0_g1_i2.p1 TRINITY_DN2236_c0_g1~~TRINITY_DN2236_c0_g1_i2.p1  ORF type:complete len:726 (+),score=339.47 TRINITY_DN2236_c0_g1_i2:222-2399(+)
MERGFEITVTSLQAELDRQQLLLRQKEADWRGLAAESHAAEQRLVADKQQLAAQLTALHAAFDSFKAEAAEQQARLEHDVDTARAETLAAQAALSSKVIFDTTREPAWNRLNVARCAFKNKRPQRALLAGLAALLVEHQGNAAALDDADVQRLQAATPTTLSADLRQAKTRLVSVLGAHDAQLASVRQALNALAAKPAAPTELQVMADRLHKYVEFSRELTRCHVLRLEEESRLPDCPASTRARNSLIIETRKQMQQDIVRLVGGLELSLLGKDGSPGDGQERQAFDSADALRIVSSNLATLDKTMSALGSQLAAKFGHENKDAQLPPLVHQLNQRIDSALQSLLGSLGKVRHMLQAALEESLKRKTCYVQGALVECRHVSAEQQRLRAATVRYMRQANSMPSGETVPYEEAVRERHTLRQLELDHQLLQATAADTANLLDNARQSNQSLNVELSSVKTHLQQWQQQSAALSEELRQVKAQLDDKTKALHEALMHKKLALDQFKALQALRGGVSADDASPPVPASSAAAAAAPEATLMASGGSALRRSKPAGERGYTVLSVLDAAGLPLPSNQLSVGDRQREAALRQHYEAKLNQLLSQVRLADGVAVRLHAALSALHQDYRQCQAQRDAMSKHAEQTDQRELLAKEDLEVTRRNYDDQMKLLSEHISALNDSVANYEDQLDALRNSRVQCAKCKTWNTIQWLLNEGLNGRRCSGGNHASSFNFS